MGCDIHLYIEYKSKDAQKWNSFGGRINPGRNYTLFTLMAGVRCYDTMMEYIKPRGMPENCGYYSTGDNQLYISETKTEECVLMSDAQRWVDNGSSKFIFNQNGQITWVTHPDWHSHSWLTTTEFENVLKKYFELEAEYHKIRIIEHQKMVSSLDIKKDSWMYNPPLMNNEPQYQVILASMKAFEDIGYDVRIVFWFDN
jgi:hypothetical protein